MLDIKTAFLHGKLNEEIYMMQPEGFIIKGQESKVYRLEQALYGLKQASLTWNKEAHKSLLELGFSCKESDPGVYWNKSKRVIVVDDVIFVGYDKTTVIPLNEAAFLRCITWSDWV